MKKMDEEVQRVQTALAGKDKEVSDLQRLL